MSASPPFPPAGSLPTGASPEESLQQGLAALKGRRYATAIQRFSTLHQDDTLPKSLRLKAHMGLIQGLHKNRQTAEAVSLCQPLCHHPKAEVRQWAQATLAKLATVPLRESAQPSETPVSGSEAAPSTTDLSGFQPLEPTAPPPTGLVSLSSDSVVPATQSVEELSSKSSSAALSSFRNTPLNPDNLNTSLDQTPAMADAASLRHDPASPPLSEADKPLSHSAAAASAPTPVPAETEEPASMPESEPTVPSWEFPPDDRLAQLRPLPSATGRPFDQWTGWGVQGITAIALFWICRLWVQEGLTLLARGLQPLQRIVPLPLGWRYQDHTILVILTLGGLLLASPWILDWLLMHAYGQKSLSIQTLKQTHPEGCRLLRRIGQQQGWLLPAMRKLPTPVPLMFSYGWLPRYGRIVVSQGLLDSLTDDELATLMGYELSHFTTWTLPLMSLIATLLQLLHQGYWQMAQWGDRQQNQGLKTLVAGLSTLAYGLYWLLRKVCVLAAQARVASGDRQAVAWTGNPNALVRALVKLEAGIAAAIGQAGQTPPLLESLDLFLPCSYEAAISRGSVYPDPAFRTLFTWDTQNPYRHWLALNSSHPPLGERIKQLTKIAVQWQLTPALPPLDSTAQVSIRSQAAFWDYWVPFLQQISPYGAPAAGIVVAMLMWFLGGLFKPLGVWQIDWFYGDQSLLQGGILLGLGLGILLRINRYFPDITATNRTNNPTVATLLKNPMGLPTDSRSVRLTGTLIGRQGIANWCCQDLILKTPNGLLKLHFFSSLGAFGNLFIHPNHPTNWIRRPIELQGWFRKGGIGWMDVDLWRQSGKVVVRGNHPIWSVVLSLCFCALGIYQLLQG